MPNFDTEEVINELEKRGATNDCPRCGNDSFSVIEGYFNNSLQQETGVIQMGGPTVPTVGVACTNCGFIAEHALGILDLLETDESESA